MTTYILLVVVMAMGVWLARQRVKIVRQSQPASVKDPQPMCGCGHHYAIHDENGLCTMSSTERVLVERGSPKTVTINSYGDRKIVYENEKWEMITNPCACKRYTGPEPMPRYLP